MCGNAYVFLCVCVVRIGVCGIAHVFVCVYVSDVGEYVCLGMVCV